MTWCLTPDSYSIAYRKYVRKQDATTVPLVFINVIEGCPLIDCVCHPMALCPNGAKVYIGLISVQYPQGLFSLHILG
jgi:hypothetical protein